MSPSIVTAAPVTGWPSEVSMCSTHSCTTLIGGVTGSLDHDPTNSLCSERTPSWTFADGVAPMDSVGVTDGDANGASADGLGPDGEGPSRGVAQPPWRTTTRIS